jgi:hypothetical protein
MAGRDKFNTFTASKALPASVTTEYSDVLDTGAGKDAFGATLASGDVGQGKPAWLNIVMLTAASTASSPTAIFSLEHSTAEGSGYAATLVATATLAAATMVKGYKVMSIPLQAVPALNRYLRINCTSGTAGFTTGTYEAWLDDAPLANY